THDAAIAGGKLLFVLEDGCRRGCEECRELPANLILPLAASAWRRRRRGLEHAVGGGRRHRGVHVLPVEGRVEPINRCQRHGLPGAGRSLVVRHSPPPFTMVASMCIEYLMPESIWKESWTSGNAGRPPAYGRPVA